MKSIVILPTYNERENLAAMVEAILALRLGLDILIVDDNSPDGTGMIAEELKATYSQVDVLHRPGKAGLGRAYVHAFQVVLARGYERVVDMDCDFSHHPRYLPALLAAAQEYDLVMGSRYVPGGGVCGWPWGRKLLSRGGSAYARLVLGLPYHDLTGGFRCLNRALLQNLGTLQCEGYAFQIEMVYRAYCQGFRIKEVPIVFYDRQQGRSKMNWAITREALWRVWALRLS